MANAGMTDDWREQLAARVDTFFDTRLGPDIVEDAQRNAPVLTGRLRESIDHSVEDHELRVTAHTEYAAAVENGHRVVVDGQDTGRFVEPDPFLRPALYKKRRYPTR
jgi:hypothetical protein